MWSIWGLCVERDPSNLLYTFYALAICYCFRLLGRWLNPQYRQFLEVVHRATRNPGVGNMEELRIYDFQFTYWPPTFTSFEMALLPEPTGSLEWYLTWLLANTIGTLALYPGIFVGWFNQASLQVSGILNFYEYFGMIPRH
ncbi:Abhydrolase domain-containing protein 16A [Folsomia candida]|uniref:Abhydrolase domain-containing protein 16A n=1 Tax=Folsomia candida TaxID=158441 RepID=A0A226DPY1_FOLCA|nr:Abhydrolase domain-containing protein 16A [Folsomia candida]